jgi:carboxymethylenebutenolidase
MAEKNVDIKTPDGVADCELFTPEKSSGQWPGVIMYPDIGGLRPVFRDMARQLASEGYAVLVPNPFYRLSRVPVYRDFKFGDDKTTERMGEVRKVVTPPNVERDAHAFVSFLTSRREVAKSKIGTVGYCMGGGMAMRTAAAEPDKVGAAVSFHGSNLATAEPDSPHLLAPKIKARMYFGFAIEDRTMPPEAVDRLKGALDEARVKYDGELYAGARHGWCVKDHHVYHEQQAEHAWHHLVQFFKQTLQ